MSIRSLGQIAALLAAVAAGAFLLVTQLASSRTDNGRVEVPQPGFLTEALGPPQAEAPLVRKPARDVRVAIEEDGYRVQGRRQSVGLSFAGGGGEWDRFESGASRTTAYGRETITVDDDKVEQFLTVAERQGPRTWRWRIEAGLNPRVTPEGWVGFFTKTNRLADPAIAPVAIFDPAGRDVTPKDLRWAVASERGAWWLTLRLDDRGLPLPYVIDPSIVYRTNTTAANTGTSAVLTIPATAVEGDLLLVHLAVESNTALDAAPSGWAKVYATDNVAGTRQVQQVFRHRVSSSDVPGTTTVTLSWTSSQSYAAQMLVYQGVDTALADPVDAQGTHFANAGNSWNVTLPAITTSATNTMIVGLASVNTNVTTWPTPGGWTSRGQVTGGGSLMELGDYEYPCATTCNLANTTITLSGGTRPNAQLGDTLSLITDTTPPTDSLSVTETAQAGKQYFDSAANRYYYSQPAVGNDVTFTIESTVTDAGSGRASTTFPTISATGFTGTGVTDTTVAYSSNPYTITSANSAAPASPTLTSADQAGNNSSPATTFSIVRDVTAPSGALTVNGTAASTVGTTSRDADGLFPIDVRTDHTETMSATASGLAAASTLGREFAAFSAYDTCGSYGGSTWITGNPSESGLLSGCYRYTLSASDNVGNTDSLVTIVKVNLPPSVTVSLGPASPTTNQTLTATATPSDPESDPVTLAFVWKKNGVTISGQTSSTLDLSVAGNGDKGDTISVEVTPSDGINTGSMVSDSEIVINSLPTATASLAPASPKTNDTLTATITTADADGDTVTVSRVWKKNAAAIAGETGTTLDLSVAGNGDKGDTITIEVTPSDGAAGTTVTDSEVVANSLPTATASLAPASPNTNDTLTATISTNDADGDTVTVTRVWKKNAAVITGETGTSLDLSVVGNGNKGDTISIEVTPSDGAAGTMVSDSEVVVNSLPTATVSLPAAPKTNDLLTATPSTSDADGDTVTVSYVWKKNGVAISGETASSLNLATAGNGDKGDTITVEATPSDGASGTTATDSEAIVNSLPTATVSVAPASPKTNDTLTATISTSDADGDTVTVTRVWKKNAAVITGETATTLDLSVAGNGDKGDTMTIEVTPSDGASGSTVTGTVTVANSLPTATVALNTASPKTNDTLTTTVTTADADGDAVTVSYVWKKNGTAITGQTGSTLNLATAGNGDKGDTIAVELTPSDGASGSTVTDTATVANTLPTATVALNTASPKTNDTLTATPSTSDADGDTVTVSYVWKKNGTAISGQTASTLNLATAGNGDKGDSITVEATPSDGASGSTVTDAATVVNSLPTATVSLSPVSPKTNDVLTASISTADADGDTVTVTRVWKRNAATIAGQTGTSLNLATAGHGDKGDTVTIEVTPSDGASGSTVTGTETVINSLPVAAVSLSPASPKTNDTLSASVSTSDADGDTVTVTRVWKRNGSVIAGQTGSSLNLATAGNGDKGDTVAIEVTPNDGADSGSTVSNSETVANTLPTATVSLAPAAPKTNDTLTATISTADADGDAVTVSRVWTKNGTAIAGETGTTLNLATAGNGDKGDTIAVEVTPSDGAAGATVTDSEVVANSLPTATVSVAPASPKTNDTLTATISTSDADGDVVTVTRVWKKNAAVLTGETATTLNLATAGNGDKGDTMTIEVTPSDGASGSMVTGTVTVANTAPVLTSATVDQSSPQTNDTLTATIVSSDVDGDTLTYTRQWRKNAADLTGETATSLNLATAGNGDKGDSMALRVSVSDGSGSDGPLTSSAVVVANTAPVLSSVTIDQGSPKTNDTLTATIVASDADGDALTTTRQWRKNLADLTGETAASLNLATAGNGDKGDSMALRASVSDGSASAGPLTSSAVTVVNSAPTATVSLSPAAPKTNDTLTATITTADADGDTVTVTRVWKKNGAVLAGQTGTTLDLSAAGNGDEGDSIAVEVTPNDGTVGGTMVNDTKTVGNSAPTATVSLAPASPKTNDTLTASVTTSDADSDIVTVSYVWKKNGTAIAGQTGSTLNLATVDNGDKGDTITVEVTPNDGTVSGPTVSDSKAVANSLPTATVALSSSTPKTNDTLTTTVTSADADGDIVTVSYAWKKNGTAIAGQTASSLNLATAGNGDKGDTITVEATPSDGAGGSTVSDTATVANSAPVLSSVTIDQGAPKTNDTVSATIVSSDADGDALTTTRQWRKNVADLTGETAATLNLATAGNGDKGDTIALRVSVSDGAASAGPLTSAAVTVQNTLPTATVALSSAAPKTNDTLTTTVTSADADGDTVTVSYVWKKNGTAIAGQTASSLNLATAGNGDKGDTIAVEATPSDGAAGTTVNDTATVANTLPTATVSLDTASPKTNDTLTATITTADADGDPVTVTRAWKKNGTAIAGETGTTLNLATAGNGDKGDTLTIEATPSDGAAGFTVTATATVANTLPTATVSVAPASPKTNDTLTATITTADADGDTVTVTRAWKKNAAVLTGETATTLDLATAGNGDKGDTMTIEVTPSDGASGSTVTGTVTVANSAPTVASATINESSPKTNDVLSVSVTSADADGDARTYTYQWAKNGVDIAFATGATLDLAQLGNGDKGDTITVRVTASDGSASSSPVTSGGVAVQNSAPVVDSAAISQVGPKTNDTLSLSLSSHDDDGDAVTYAYQWRKNGADLAGRTATTLDLSQAGNGDKGDALAVRVTAGDGSATSTPVTSGAVTVQNTAPTATVSLSPGSPKTNDTLTTTVTTADADGDTVTVAYVWKKNGTAIAGQTGSSLNLDTAGNGDKGDSIAVEATPNDGSAGGSTVSDSKTVVNSLPTATVSLSSASPKTNDTLTTTVSTADADGDTVTVAYVWKKNGTAIAGQTTSTLNLATAGNGDKGDTITVEVTPNDGAAGSVVSATATVADSAPTATVSLSSASPRTNDTLTASTTTNDADGDAVTLGFVWKKNGTAISGQTGSTLNLATAGHGDKGDGITVEVTPAGGAIVSDSATIANSAPVLSSVAIDQASPKTNDMLTATIASSDADGDALTTTRQWLKNTVDVSGETGATFNLATAGNGQKGDSISLRASISDGTASDGPTTSGGVTVANSTPACSNTALTTIRDTANETAPVCSDADGDTLGPAVVAQGSLGTASINTGQLRYVPNASVTGTDSFTYKANDGTVDSAAATVNVTINEPVPTAPNVPALQSPAAAAFTSATPTLTARFADVNTADTGTIEFQVCSDAACSTVVASFSSASGIANGADGSAAPAVALTDATTYHWRARATDDTARTSSWSSTRSFTVDISGPTPAVSFPAADGNYRAATWSSFAGTTADGGSGVAQVDVAVKRLSDGLWWKASISNWETSVPPLFATAAGTNAWSYGFPETNFATDGVYELHVKATDALGNPTTVTRTFRIDRVAPSTANDAPAPYRNSAVTVTLSPTDGGSGVAATTYEVNGGATQTGTSVSIPATQGTYTITFRSTDAAGNVEADKTATVRIDTTAPTTTDDAPAGYRNGPVTVTLSPTDSGGAGVSTTTYEVNAGATLTGTSVSIPGTQGTYTITYRSTDAAGNAETTKTTTVRIDTTAPTTTDNAPAAWRNGAVTVTLSPTDSGGAGVQATTYELDGGLTQTGTSVSVPATSGAHTIVYRSTDTATNAEANRTATVNVDVTAPTVSITYPTGGALVSGVVTITTSPASDAHSGVAGVAYSYSLAGANDWQSTSSSWNTAALADGSYDVRAVVTDNAGNTGQSLSAGVQVDNNPPSLTFSAPTYLNAASANPYTLSATASDGGTGVANVEFFQQVGASWSSIAADTTSPYSAAWTLPADGPQTLKAVATDNVGHPREQTVTLTVDRTPPTATMADPGAYVRGAIELSTAASDATTSVTSVAFQRSPAGADTWTTIATDTNGADGWKANLDTTGLADALYDLRVFATDAAGNSSTSTVASRRVDNTKPTAGITDPGAFLRATVTLAGSATDGGSGVASVEFQRSPAGLATWTSIGTDTTPGDGWSADLVTTSLTDGDYDLRVVVTDRAGNSETSSIGSRRVDNTKPTAATADPGQYLRGTIALSGTATDDGSGVASVEFQRSPAGASTWTQIAVDADGADGWSASFVTTSVTDGLYDLRVVVTDRAGNSETATVATRRVDNTKPTAGLIDPGANLRSTVTLTGTATDAGSGVASVAFDRSAAGSGGPWTAIGTDTDGADGWSTSFDTAAAGDGLYDLRVVATDRAGNSETATVATRRVDNTAPTTGHNAPGGPAASDVTVTLTPSDSGSGASATQYRVDAGAWQSGASVLIPAPSDHSNDGSHTIEFYSTDAAGNVEGVRSATVVIDTTGASAGPTDPGAYLRGVVTLEASPADTSGIVSVEFQFSPAGMEAWAAVGTDLVAPYSVTWDTTTVGDGQYDLRVRVIDGAGNVTTTNLPSLPKVVDNASPTGSVTAPAANAYLSGTVTVSASASDVPVASAIASVEFQVKPAGAGAFSSLGTDTSSPYSVSWNTTAMPDGPAELRVIVTDIAGNPATTSAVRTVSVDNDAPTVEFSHPSINLAGLVTLNASGAADLASITFQRSPAGANTWTAIGTDATAPFEAAFDTTAVADGQYDVRAVGTDGSGNTGTSATRTLRVDNTAPTGSMSDPSAGDTVGGPSVGLEASAADAGSGVASVSFQFRPTGSGSFTDISGSTWDATGLASGSYDVRAVIRDNAGNEKTTAAVTVTVDSTAPTVALANPGSSLQGSVTLTATVSGSGATSVTFGARPAGSGTWNELGSDQTAPYALSLDTKQLSDGEYDLRAVVADQYGNTNADVRAAIRIDNTAPSVASSSPADGAIVASASSIAVTASETLLAVDDLKLDGAPVSVTPSGVSFSIDASSLAAGPHRLGGKLRDLAGRTKPFRVHFTIVNSSAPDVSYVERNAARTETTTLTAVDSSATVTMPAGAWSDPGTGDWLVLRVDPVPAAAIAGPTSLIVSAIVDVTARWALAETEQHDFNAPLDILVANTGGEGVVPATLAGGSWRPMAAIPGGATTLPAGWSDGFYREGGAVHVLTWHLSKFALLRDIEAPEPPGAGGVVAEDGLTLRWYPGRDNSGLIRRITLLVNGVPYQDFDPTQFEVKMGPLGADDTRVFSFIQQDAAGNWSAESGRLRTVPGLAGKTLAEAENALTERGFSLGAVREEPSPTALPGTVIEPAGVLVAAMGSTVDLVVAAGAAQAADSRLVFGVVGTKKFSWKTGKSIAVRVKTTRAAKVRVSLMSPRGERVYTWRFSVKAGRTIKRLPMPRQVQRAGKYRLVVTATSGSQVVRRTIPVQIVQSGPAGKRGRAPQRQPVEIVLAGSSRVREDIALGLDTAAARIIQADGGDAAFDATGSPRRNVQIVVVDVDRYGVGLVRDLHVVFPSVKVIALSRRPELLLRALKSGAAAAVPPSAPAPRIAKMIRSLSGR